MAETSRAAAAALSLVSATDQAAEIARLRKALQALRYLAEAGDAHLTEYEGCVIDRADMRAQLEAMRETALRALGEVE